MIIQEKKKPTSLLLKLAVSSGLCWDGPAGNTVFAFVRLIYGNLNWYFLC